MPSMQDAMKLHSANTTVKPTPAPPPKPTPAPPPKPTPPPVQMPKTQQEAATLHLSKATPPKPTPAPPPKPTPPPVQIPKTQQEAATLHLSKATPPKPTPAPPPKPTPPAVQMPKNQQEAATLHLSKATPPKPTPAPTPKPTPPAVQMPKNQQEAATLHQSKITNTTQNKSINLLIRADNSVVPDYIKTTIKNSINQGVIYTPSTSAASKATYSNPQGVGNKGTNSNNTITTNNKTNPIVKALTGPMPDINTQFGVGARLSTPIGTVSFSVGFIGDNNGNRAVEATFGYGVNKSTEFKSKGATFGWGPFIGLYQGTVSDWGGDGTNAGGSIPVISVDTPDSSGKKGVQISTGSLGMEGHAEITKTWMISLPKKKDENDPWLIQ